MKSVEEYFYLYYDLKDEMIRLSKEGNDIRKAFITKIYCVPKSEVKSNYNDLKKITKLPSKKQFGDLAYSRLKERFHNAEDIMIREAKFNQEVFFVVAYIDWKKVSFTVNSTALLFHLIKKCL